MFYQLTAVNGTYGSFRILNQHMEPIGEMIQTENGIAVYQNDVMICEAKDLAEAAKLLENEVKKDKAAESVEAFRAGNRIEGIRIFKRYVNPNMNIGQIRDYLEKVM